MRRHRLNALFLTQVYLVSKLCPSLLEVVGLRVPARHIRDFALFSVYSSCKNCPSARCASAANVCRNVDVFRARNVFLYHFYIIIIIWMLSYHTRKYELIELLLLLLTSMCVCTRIVLSRRIIALPLEI
jgi:hypothetical protein